MVESSFKFVAQTRQRSTRRQRRGRSSSRTQRHRWVRPRHSEVTAEGGEAGRSSDVGAATGGAIVGEIGDPVHALWENLGIERSDEERNWGSEAEEMGIGQSNSGWGFFSLARTSRWLGVICILFLPWGPAGPTLFPSNKQYHCRDFLNYCYL